MRRTVHLAATVAVSTLLWGCASPNVEYADALSLYEDGDYYQAYVSILEAREADSNDPDIESDYWRLRQAFLLSEAQRLVFASEEHLALGRLEMVLALDPQNSIALRWKQKALEKLADRAISEGELLVAAGELEGALAAFDLALKYDPGSPRARKGIDALGEVWRKTQEAARGHYIDGVRALGDHEFGRTSYHLGIAMEKDPTLLEAVDPLEIAARQIVADRFAAARGMEDEGYYRPALREYELILAAYPDFEGVEERIARARTEVEVADLADAGEMKVYRGDFEGARELLDEALGKTARQKEAVAELLLLARERELDMDYIAAKDLELQRLLDRALVAYADIEATIPGYSDVRARISDLELRIEEAQTAYAAGLAAEEKGDLDGAIEGFTDVQLFWQGYLDSRQHLDALRELRAEKNGT